MGAVNWLLSLSKKKDEFPVSVISLNDWLEKQNLEPSNDLFSTLRTEIQKYILTPSNELVEQGDPVSSIVVFITAGEQKYQFTFEGYIDSIILNKDYRFSRFGGKYVLIVKENPPYRYSLYQKKD